MYLFSLREFLWLKLYEGALPPEHIVLCEIIVSLIVTLLILVSWFGVRRLFFIIAHSAKAARKAGLIFSICWACAWMVGSLEFLGYRSFAFMVTVLLFSSIASIGYLVWVRKR